MSEQKNPPCAQDELGGVIPFLSYANFDDNSDNFISPFPFKGLEAAPCKKNHSFQYKIKVCVIMSH